MNLSKLIGSEAAFPLEHRILNTVFLIGIVLCLLTIVSNYLIELEFMAFISAICAVALGALYYFSIVKSAYRAVLLAGVSLAFAVLPVSWINCDGLYGPAPFYILIFAAMITVSVSRTPSIYCLTGCLAVLTAGLLARQYFYPHEITVIASRASLFASNFIAMMAALMVITFLYVVILGYYRREHARATEYLLKLEKQGMELEMARLDRLSLIGEMAASIGHEVRNPLTTIRGYLQVFRHKEEYACHYEHFEMMIGELDRANAIITEFLSLAKNKVVRMEPCDLNEILGRIVPLIRAGALEAGKEVLLKIGKAPAIAADEGEIRQLVLNLANNALDAIGPGGRVTIGTRSENGRAVLIVSDTGRGIPPEIYARLGTPFLTTKEKGTGLGIPICFRIAERHNAEVKIDTGPRGTTFRVSFPATGKRRKAAQR